MLCLSSHWKIDKEAVVRTQVGRVLVNVSAAIGKAQSPKVVRRVEWTSTDEVSADLKRQRAARYDDNVLWWQRYTRTHSRNWISSATLSQWRSRSSGAMSSDYFTEKTSRAAELRIDCYKSNRRPELPTSTKLQFSTLQTTNKGQQGMLRERRPHTANRPECWEAKNGAVTWIFIAVSALK